MTADLAGYTDQFSVRPGETLQLMVSTSAEAFDVGLVRLLHGDEHPDGPGLCETELACSAAGPYPGRRQQTRTGSYVVGPPDAALAASGALRVSAWIWPTLRSDEVQVVCSAGDGRSGWALELAQGRIRLSARGPGWAETVQGPELVLREWAHVAAAVAPAQELLRLEVDGRRGAGSTVTAQAEGRMPRTTGWAGAWPLVVAGRQVGGPAEPPEIAEHYNGKVDSPLVRLCDDAADTAVRWHAGKPVPADAILAWDFSRGSNSSTAVDASGHGRDGRVVNVPARTMTGPRWNGRVVDPGRAPELWSAIHFHEDDLEDAGWEADVAWRVPDDLASGVYAFRVRAGDDEDRVPFVVAPPKAGPFADVALLLPTYTYLAYANERGLDRMDVLQDLLPEGASPPEPHRADVLLRRHPEWGLSCYDEHRDGSGCCHSSRLRPIPNLRPEHRFWATGGPERFGSDLYVTHFLHEEGVAADVITDEDLHRDGIDLLSPYRVILTGTHPEYWTERMLDALERYLHDGGRLMYLGGNGFYWVTSVDAERPHVVEIRRGINGTRAWSSEPGETHHDQTGEPGGLWRYRGRDPGRLVGVAFAAQCDTPAPAAGYRQLPGARDPRTAFIFDGVDEREPIGEFGLINGGAAGYEIDRTDPGATPLHAVRLATSEGLHDAAYVQVVEDLQFTHTDVTGTTSAAVRSDLVYLEYPDGGAVFSVGSCNWCSALSHNGYDNNVATITRNVLARFAAAGS